MRVLYNVRCYRQASFGSSLRSHSMCSLAAELGRYTTATNPVMNSSLQHAHAHLTDYLGEDIEPLSVWERVDEHRTFWRPEKTRLLLLAESHVHTALSELEHVLRPTAMLPQNMPLGFVRLVYSLGYGENGSLTQPIRHPRNDGTWQFWKIFSACVHEAQANSAFASVLKGGTPNATHRLANKVSVLKSLQERGVWLLDASVAALYSPTGSRRAKPHPRLRDRVLKTSWDAVIRETIVMAEPEAILCIGMEVARSLAARLGELGIPWGAIHQPQSHLESAGHMKNWAAYYRIAAKPRLVRELPSVL